jgi:hypothetical protein
MMDRMPRKTLGGFGLGALFAFLFDPQSGRRRRAQVRDQALGAGRGTFRRTARLARIAGSYAVGYTHRVFHRRPPERRDPDDATLAAKIETELFRPADVPKGQINVNVQNGVVQLRGEVPQLEMIDKLVEKARRVDGVRDVENLLHLPNTPARMHQ